MVGKFLLLASLGAAIIGAAPGRAGAVPIILPLTLNYVPPSPCTGNLLDGLLGLFEMGPGGASPVIQTTYPPSPCNASSATRIVFAGAIGTALYLGFSGAIQHADPGMADTPVFAFAQGTVEGSRAVASAPASTPLILLGTVIAGGIQYSDPGPPTLPLFAFASPGVEVGSLSVGVASTIPEPGTLMLFAFGLFGIVLLRRRRIPAAARSRSSMG